MELLEQQLILERDIKQAQQDNSRLVDKNEQLKKDSISFISLIEKQKKTLKDLEEQSVKVLDKVRDEKVTWENQKREEQEKLQAKELVANKILNRENYVKVQEQELLKRQAEATRQEQTTAVKEASFSQREELIKNLEAQADKHWQEAKKVSEYSKQAMETLKENIVKEINNWETK